MPCKWSKKNIIMSEFYPEGDTVIDIGANIGTTVLSCQKMLVKKEKFLNHKLLMSNA